LSDYALRPASFSFSFYIRSLFYPQDNVIINFWFLPTLFLILLIFGIIGRNPRIVINSFFNTILTIALVFICAHNPLPHIKFFNFSGALYYLVYFWIGGLLWLYKEKLSVLGRGVFSIILLSLLLALNALAFHNPYAKLVTALTGIMLSYSIFRIYEKKKIRVFNFIDGYVYQIFLLSWFFETSIRIACYQILKLNYVFVFALILTCGIALPVLVSKFIYRHFPRLRLVIGMG